MPRVSPLLNDFSSGEISPLMFGRIDADRYKTGLETCLNMVPLVQGGVTRRPGTRFAAEVKDSSKFTRVIPFEFSKTQAYIIEAGNQYFRFYRNGGLIGFTAKTITGATAANPVQITSNAHGFSNGDRIVITGVAGMVQLNNREFRVAGVTANTFTLQHAQSGSAVNGTTFTAYTSGGGASKIVEVASPYLEAELPDIRWAQSNDVVYIVHPNYAPRKLTRTDHTVWTLTTVAFEDGPYLSPNDTAVTITPSATTGNITLTASSALFAATDVDRLVRLTHSSTTGYVKITGFTSTTVVNATVQLFPGTTSAALGGTGATTSWRLGLYFTASFPSFVAFHQARLILGGASAAPLRVDASVSQDFENFQPTQINGTSTADNLAIAATLDTGGVNKPTGFVSHEKGGVIMSAGGEFFVRPNTTNAAITPTDIQAPPISAWGSINVSPVRAGASVLFVQASGYKIRELRFDLSADGFNAIDLTVISEHILESGVREMAWQKEPQPILWVVRKDGHVASLTFERDSDTLRAAWHRHVFGGKSTAGGDYPVAEAVAFIPNSGNTYDEGWFIVRRIINGQTVRTVQYFSKSFDREDEQHEAYFVDCGLSRDVSTAITGATAANPVVVTSTSHGLTNGDEVFIQSVKGMTQINGKVFTVANAAANTFELSGVDGTAYTAYASGGVVIRRTNSLSGLFHLEGETLAVLGDGAPQASVAVSAGSVTLDQKAGFAHVGFPFNSDIKTLPLDAGAARGSAGAQLRRVHRANFRVYRTQGMKIGPTFSNLDTVVFRTPSDITDAAVPLFTGQVAQQFNGSMDTEGSICLRMDEPTPATILFIAPIMETNER